MKRIHKISRQGACSFQHAPYLLLQYKLYSGIFCRGISWLLIGNSVQANEEQLTSQVTPVDDSHVKLAFAVTGDANGVWYYSNAGYAYIIKALSTFCQVVLLIIHGA